jgi:hypothetical protein
VLTVDLVQLQIVQLTRLNQDIAPPAIHQQIARPDSLVLHIILPKTRRQIKVPTRRQIKVPYVKLDLAVHQ